MTIIKLCAEVNGAHANQSGDIAFVPEGWARIPDNLLPVWEQYKPFVALTVEDGIITDMADNPEARAAQEAADAAIIPEPDLQADMSELLIDLAYRTTLLELGVSI